MVKMAKPRRHHGSHSKQRSTATHPVKMHTRSELRMAEDNSQEELIETYVANANPYRVAFPGIPQPLPLPSTTSLTIPLAPYLGHIIEILTADSLDCTGMSAMCYRPGEDVILLVVTTRPTINKNYKEGAKHVHEYLKGQGHFPCQVEVRHNQHWQNTAMSPDRLSDTAVEQFEAVTLQLRAAVESLLGSHTCGFSLYLRTKPFQEPEPTVLVLIKPGATHNWARTKAFLRDMLTDRGCHAEVELLPGWIRDGLGGGGLLPCEYDLTSPTPQNGASIAIEGDCTSAGTLGGFVRLTKPSTESDPAKTWLCGLTNHHVVRPIDPVLAAKVHASGIALSSNGDPKAHVQYPSTLDLQATVMKYTDRMAEYTMAEAGPTLEADSALEDYTYNRKMQKKKQYDLIREHFRLQLELCKKLEEDQRIGRVLVSSGLSGCPPPTLVRPVGDTKTGAMDDLKGKADPEFDLKTHCGDPQCHRDHWKRDWALIELREEVFTVNTAPPASQVRGAVGVYFDGDSNIVDTLSPITPDMWVTFRGRTSGVVCGKVKGPKFNCLWRYSYGSGDQAVEKSFWSSEYQILPLPKSNGALGQAGDSGSWVIDEVKSLVGMIHAKVEGTQIDISLFTSIFDIFNDIEKTTGGKVTLPKYCDGAE